MTKKFMAIVLTGVYGVLSINAANPIMEGWYADPEAVIYDNTYWVYPTRSLPYEEQVALDAFSSPDLF